MRRSTISRIPASLMTHQELDSTYQALARPVIYPATFCKRCRTASTRRSTGYLMEPNRHTPERLNWLGTLAVHSDIGRRPVASTTLGARRLIYEIVSIKNGGPPTKATGNKSRIWKIVQR